MLAQSATSISDFKRCVILYHMRHNLKLRPIEDSESLRQGTNWHRCLEILRLTPGGPCPCADLPDAKRGDCALCEDTGFLPDDMQDALIRYMNQVYATCPPSVDLVAWEVERTILLYSAIGWRWYYQDEKVETLACEVPFNREINSVYNRRGKIDKIERRDRILGIGEYKSTAKPIDSGALYWDHLNLDSQPTMYLIEARHAQLAGLLEPHGIMRDDPLISGVLYDVWHKPGIKPKKLSQGDTKKFMPTGEYYGEKFEVKIGPDDPDRPELGLRININGTPAEITWGAEPKPTKKTPNPPQPFAIRETPGMFGARLLDDIQKNPEKHFARKEIVRTDEELRRADEEFYNIARTADIMTKQNLWFRNEHQCRATFTCPFHTICYYGIDVSKGQVPEGFRCTLEHKND
ncbi:MAG TPA: hypothetical protein ENI27_09245 [bacterium]|nr:hypothetical protein [bacterium]